MSLSTTPRPHQTSGQPARPTSPKQEDTTITLTKRPKKLFYGWWIALAAAAANALSGGIYFYGFSTFFVPLEQEFGWGRAVLSGAFSLSRLEGGLYGPLGGYLVDRFGPRPVMFAGISLMGVGYFLLSRIDSIVAFYIVFVLMIAGGASMGIQVPPLVTTAKWFIRRRGTAMGIALSGVGLGGLILPILGWLIENFGWRTTANISGMVVLGFGLPLTMLMRSRPEKYGLLPDGATAEETAIESQSPDASGRQEQAAETNFTVRQALATPVFWFLALAFGLRQLVVSAVALHQIPALIDIGISQQTAATMLGSLALLSIIGRMGFGWLGDHLEKRKLMAFSLMQLAVGCLIFANVTEVWQVILFLLVYSPAYGGGASMMFAIRGEYFGRESFGTISGLMDSFQMFGLVLGPVFAGFVFDATGSYRTAFFVFAASAALASILMLFLRRPRQSETLPQMRQATPI